MDRTITLGAPPCDTTSDFQLALRSRREPPAPLAPTTAPENASVEGSASNADASSNGSARWRSAGRRCASNARHGRGRGGAARGAGARAGRRTAGARGFPDTDGAGRRQRRSHFGVTPADDAAADATRLLPSGFSLQDAQSDCRGDFRQHRRDEPRSRTAERSRAGDRARTIRSVHRPVRAGLRACTHRRRRRARTGRTVRRPRRRPGGGGRGGVPCSADAVREARARIRARRRIRSVARRSTPLPYQINPGVATTQPPSSRRITFGTTFGGPLKIPGVNTNAYPIAGRISGWNFHTGSLSNNLFDQYATVPTDAMRAGNFSGTGVQIINPKTGQPFANNQIPASSLNPSAQYLLNFIFPRRTFRPNATGGDNYHTSRTNGVLVVGRPEPAADAKPFRDTSAPEWTRRTRRFSAAEAASGTGGRVRGGRGTNVVLQAQLQYRRNETESPNVFQNLGSRTTNTSVTVPISLNVVRNRFINNFSRQYHAFEHGHDQQLHRRDKCQRTRRHQLPVEAHVDQSAELGRNAEPVVYKPRSGPPGGSRHCSDPDTRVTMSYVWSHPTSETSASLRRRLSGSITTLSQLNANARPRVHVYRPLFEIPRSPTSCSACRSRRPCRSAASASCVEIVSTYPLRRQLAAKLKADGELRPPLRTRPAVHRCQRSPRQPRHRPRLSRGRSGTLAGASRPILRRISVRRDQHGHEQLRSAHRPRVSSRPGHDHPQRLQHHVQPGSYATIARRLSAQPQPGFADTETVQLGQRRGPRCCFRTRCLRHRPRPQTTGASTRATSSV